MPYVEVRGNSIRVKWWNGDYVVDAEGRPTKRKKYDGASGPRPGVPFESEDEAYDYGLDREYEVRHGQSIRRVDAKTLMKDYCWLWLDAQDLRDTSMARYRSRLRCRIVPYWGEHAVGDITTWEYEAWKKSLTAAVARKEVSQNYVDVLLSLFGMLMTDAVAKYKLRRESPVIVQRSRGRFQKKKREVKRPMEMAVVHKLATNAYHVWGFTGWTCIWTIAFTGMRPTGELWGLRREFASPTWPASDPDAEQRDAMRERYGLGAMPALRVQYQSQYSGGVRTQVAPKYDSHRTLVLPPFLHEMHSALLASHTSPWVFPAMDGGQMGTHWSNAYWPYIRGGSPARDARRHRLRPEIQPVPEMANKRVYLLRHGHREWLEEDGHSRIAMEARMGHEVAGVEGVYANLTPRMELGIMETLQDRWDRFWGMGVWWSPPFPITLPRGVPER
ncbi:integrase [Streptomyces sp. NPDC048241]|uniref:integrase n=1 Tax=Streptomyces sp. NPDC048241 TaxID=3365521 RepID=UPI003713E356